jgi:hypothetical protein
MSPLGSAIANGLVTKSSTVPVAVRSTAETMQETKQGILLLTSTPDVGPPAGQVEPELSAPPVVQSGTL